MSDTEISPPVLKKQRSTRSTRPLQKASQPPAEAETSCIYSGQVSACMARLREGQLSLRVEEDSDGDVDSPTVAKEVPVRRTSRQCSAGKENLVIDSDETDNDDDDDCIEVETSQSESVRDRSPTPPPSPAMAAQVARKRRQPKAVKMALRELECAKHRASLNKSLNESVTSDDVVILDDMIAPSPEKPITVRINSRSGIQRFRLKKNESFQTVFRSMALHEGVSEQQIVMFLNDRTIQPYDKPEDVNLHIADIIDCHVSKQSTANHELDPEDPDVLEIAIQGKDPKSKTLMLVHKREPLERVIREFATKWKLKFDSLSLEFDGEDISKTDSAGGLEMEENDCIDVIES